ncbi:MAG: ROK family protein [Chromatiales bacterium]|jgi:fructokinase|nr:ROK family protein [Chromatiales bacterium]
MTQRIGIDLGGTKIEGVIMSRDHEIARRERIATPKNYADIVHAVAALVTTLWRDAPAATVGIGAPGAVDASGLTYNSNTVCLNGRALRADIATAIGQPVRMVNDANCLALSEASDGAATGADVVFGAILGTGVGGGIVVRGHVLSGPHGIAGEWGHNPLCLAGDAEGPLCYCGRHGCVETLLSGPGFAADFKRSSGATLTPAEIITAARRGDALAQAALTRYLERFGRALATVINILDPDIIVLGGGMSNIDELCTQGPAHVRRHVFHPHWNGRIIKNHWGDSSGVRGAAWLWDD